MDVPVVVYEDGDLNEGFVVSENNKGGTRIITDNGRTYNISSRNSAKQVLYLRCNKCGVSRPLYLSNDDANDYSMGILAKQLKPHKEDCLADNRFAVKEFIRSEILKHAPNGTSLPKARRLVIDALIRDKRVEKEDIALYVKPAKQIASAFSKAASASVPNSISTSSNINIPPAFRRSRFEEALGNKRFLLEQVELGNKAVWVFADSFMLGKMFQSPNWAVDGMFSVPDPFKQLVTVHFKCKETFIPAVYALMPDKTKESYDGLVNCLVSCTDMITYKNSGGKVTVKKVSSDFELNIMNSFKNGLSAHQRRQNSPNDMILIDNEACQFHYCKNLLEKAGELGLKDAMYRRIETGVWSFIKYLCVLPLIKEAEIIPTYRLLKSNKTFWPNVEGSDLEKLKALCKYFERTYLGATKANPSGSMQVVQRWNCHGRINNTNNYVEVWHSTKKDTFSKIRNVWKFVIAMQESAADDRLKYDHVIANQYIAQKTAAQKRKEKTVDHVISQYDEGSLTAIEVVKVLANHMK
jgi:hypothetical protein